MERKFPSIVSLVEPDLFADDMTLVSNVCGRVTVTGNIIIIIIIVDPAVLASRGTADCQAPSRVADAAPSRARRLRLGSGGGRGAGGSTVS